MVGHAAGSSRRLEQEGNMSKKLDLCGKCAAELREGYKLARVAGGVDNKITCSNCGKRRFGATYELEKKGGKK
jgi:hypothetical protein